MTRFSSKDSGACRKSLAQKQGVPPYIIFSDRTLREMAGRFPTTPEAMRRIHGVGDRKLDRYGELFTEEIEAHLEEAGREDRRQVRSQDGSRRPCANARACTLMLFALTQYICGAKLESIWNR